MYQDHLAVLEGKSDKFVQKFNELLDFTDHADQVYGKSGTSQKRTVLKLCIEGFTVRNQKLTPIWTPVFDVLMDLHMSKFDPPKVVGKGSKTLAVPKVLTWTSGGEGGIRTLDTLASTLDFESSPFNRSGTSPYL